MKCVYCRVEDKLPVCIKTKTPSCIPKNKIRLCICVPHHNIEFYNPLTVNSTQGILNTIE